MHVTLRLGDDEFDLYLVRENGTVKVEVDGETIVVVVVEESREGLVLDVAGERVRVSFAGDDFVRVDGETIPMRVADFRPVGTPGHHGPARGKGARVRPPMPGKIVAVKVAPGAEVAQGDVLVVLEAMKMQNEIPSPTAGFVKAIHVKPGQTVEAKDVIVEIE